MRRQVLIASAAVALFLGAAGAAVVAGLIPNTAAWSKRQAHRAVELTLKDPASAKFDHEEVSADGRTVCGNVNAKNSYGAYVGGKFFVWRAGKPTLIEQERFNRDQWMRDLMNMARGSSSDAFDEGYRRRMAECEIYEAAATCPSTVPAALKDIRASCARDIDYYTRILTIRR